VGGSLLKVFKYSYYSNDKFALSTVFTETANT